MTVAGPGPSCSRCGAQNQSASRFCFRCGAPLATASVDRPPDATPLIIAPAHDQPAAPPPDPAPYQPPPEPAPYTEPPLEPAPYIQPPPEPVGVTWSPGRQRRIPVAFLAAAIVLLLGAGAFAVFVLTRHNPSPATHADQPVVPAFTTPQNSGQSGLAGQTLPSTGISTVEESGGGPNNPEYSSDTSTSAAAATGPVPGPTEVSANDGSVYDLRIYATDRIGNCADHAYGGPAIRFLSSNPCLRGHRLLATIDVDGRQAILSVITASFDNDSDGYGTAARLRTLERAPGTGGMNDLLREGISIPGKADSIPSTEAFYVTGRGAQVAIFDAWWTHGHTADQDPTLISMESSLFPGALAPTD